MKFEQQIREVPKRWKFIAYDVSAGTGRVPIVTLRCSHGDEEIVQEMAAGDGPVDAVFLAIEEATGIRVVCKDFQVHSVSIGKDAQAEVTVEVDHKGQLYRGRGVSTDSVEASAVAFLDAINRVGSIEPAKKDVPSATV